MTVRINIGCGPNLFPGWVNLDRVDMSSYIETLRNPEATYETWPKEQQALAQAAKQNRVACAVHDIRQGLPQFADNSVDAIYLGQIIEHWNPVRETPRILDTLWRKLRPGGMLCITTPDLDLLIDAYFENRMLEFAKEQPAFYTTVTADAQLSFLLFGATGPECTTEHYEGHFMCFGRNAMAALLKAVGFENIDFSQKSDIFTDCVDYGLSHSMRVEARKPISVR